MNLYEYQGRKILEYFSIDVPNGKVAYSVEEAVEIAKTLFKIKKSLIIKAQIHAGGRGKSGGIKKAETLKDVYEISKEMFGKSLITKQTNKEGIIINKILLVEDIYTSNSINSEEHYLSILFSRDEEKNIVLYSRKGGINIEKSSKQDSHKIYKEKIDPILGIQLFQSRKIGYNLGIKNNESIKKFQKFVLSLYNAYKFCDALLIEINPLVKTYDNKIIPLDVKIILDDNALFRSKKYSFVEEKKHSGNFIKKECTFDKDNKKFNFIKLKGNVGCMVNGAGLAMATMDMIKFCGGEPANFLDIGGTANKKRVEDSFSLILDDKFVKIILINIFGGIVRCDTVAEGVINSYFKRNYVKIPIIIRLQGTNEKYAKDILKKSSLPIYYTNSLKEISNKIKKILVTIK
ncbi:ADP-forming succinate--CoA ligase subunit beta [Blattabacterium cuenoti]|uniref:ADP-forming succinate--CoA ligase subunit beta n=1 Tax=Blattabacterium cuenoti TaxID=1653831 RepID=UPI00163BAE93|nr:ADP-forming succinate--CoA ligase subunit beta [Blattabacterium cuenoti]